MPAEIGTPVEHPKPEFAPSPEASAMAESYAAEHTAGEHHDDEHSRAAQAAENAAHAEDSEAHAFTPSEANGQDDAGDGHAGDNHAEDAHPDDANGQGSEHGAEEEEEVVESVGGADAMEEVPDRAPRYRRQYKIQEVIKRRQVMLVQVVKEERGTKGAALTTYLSLAGRYCVLMPNTARGGGISRKITSADDRKKLREIAEELDVPEGMGVILRTAGAARTKQEVKRDFEYLLRHLGAGPRSHARSRPRRRWSTRKARSSSARSATSTARTSTRSSSPASRATATPRTSCACSCRAMRRT